MFYTIIVLVADLFSLDMGSLGFSTLSLATLLFFVVSFGGFDNGHGSHVLLRLLLISFVEDLTGICEGWSVSSFTLELIEYLE